MEYQTCLVFALLLISSSSGYLIDKNPYRRVEKLDPEGKYRLEWLVDWKQERVVFNVTVETKGWIGFGLSKSGEMTLGDIVIGGVSDSGRHYFSDRHGVGNEYPVRDQSQDWVLEKAWESDSHTSLKFSRKFDTCDEQDIPITDDSLAVIWAYGETDNRVEHFGNRGSFNVYLRDPELTPGYVEPQSQKGTGNTMKEMKEDGVTVWKIENKGVLSEKRTTYWCNIHKISLPKKHHAIGYALEMNTSGFSNLHHVLIFKCTVPPNLSEHSVFEAFLTHPGEECYSPGTEITQLPTQFCTDLRYGISIGGRSTFLPDHVGIPIGESPNEYYLFQAHYDNPSGSPGILVDTKVHIYHTPKVRKHDAGTFSIGHHIPGSPSLILPPGSIEHVVYGHCSPTCTQKMFPDDGINIVGLLLHSHNQGRQLRVQHFRKGTELPWISNDDNFNFRYQPGRILKKEVSILPGDQVTMRCVYDTTNRNTTTVGGYGTNQEMCKTFLTYYPKMDDYGLCRSMIISPEYTRRYLGINNVTWSKSQLEYVAHSPSHLKGQTISQVSDNSVDWNSKHRAQLQADHISHPQLAICPIATAIPSKKALEKELESKRHFVSYPDRATKYKIKHACTINDKQYL